MPRVCLLSAAAMLLLSGCGSILTSQDKDELLSGYKSYERGDDARTIAQMNAFIAEHGRSDRADEAYYLRGLAKYRQKDIAGAKVDLQTAMDRAPKRGELTGKAAIALGDIGYDTGDLDLADRMYRQSLEDLNQQTTKPADHAMYRLGCTLQRQGRWQEADAYFDRVSYQFRGADVANQAARRVRCTAWTVQAGSYKTKANADVKCGELQRNRLPATVKMIPTDAGPLYIVAVGTYRREEEAAAELEVVRRFVSGAIVVPTR
jgi:TolA-binding protein